MSATRRINRNRARRTLTFWLRPEFVLRVLNRFQKVAGFDRAVALASGALTAMIPLLIVTGSLSSQLGGNNTAQRIIDRYDLTGGGAQAVNDVFAEPSGTSSSLGVAGLHLSHPRGPELHPSRAAIVRADLGARAAERAQHIQRPALGRRACALSHSHRCPPRAPGRRRCELDAALIGAPVSAVFLAWSGHVLSAGRIARHELIPFAVLGSVLLAAYSVGATLYVPHLFNTLSTRYGVIGAVFAMISALFCVMVVAVASAAAGREVRDELDRIHRGERPADDEVRRQWNEVTTQARSRWKTMRVRVHTPGRKDSRG